MIDAGGHPVGFAQKIIIWVTGTPVVPVPISL